MSVFCLNTSPFMCQLRETLGPPSAAPEEPSLLATGAPAAGAPAAVDPPPLVLATTPLDPFQGAVWHDNACWIQSLFEGFTRSVLGLSEAQIAVVTAAMPSAVADVLYDFLAGKIDGSTICTMMRNDLRLRVGEKDSS